LVDEGKWYDGLSLLESGLKIARYGSDLNTRADMIFQIGRAHHLIGNYDKARTFYRDALRLYKHMDNQYGIANCKSGLGHLMTQIGYVDEAVDDLRTAKRLYRKLGNRHEESKVDQILKLAAKVKEKQPA
jgi:tetratricopeptide (TPR) repeat protein